ncbi:MAG: decaprenyl-phosphate phosphoribosyltransferase [Verrucomicrobiota bacterium]
MIKWIKAFRVNQWTKNGFVFVAFVFAFGVKDSTVTLGDFWLVCLAALLFSLTSSGIYLINDMLDLKEDRAHPIKKSRPLASGAIAVPAALTVAILLLAAGLSGAFFVALNLALVIGCYILMQLGYSFGLKKIALLDVFFIAIGFVLRALAGGVAIDVPISPWLILCTFLLALFIAICKRRHEKVVEEEFADQSRPSLQNYDIKLLDQLIAIASSATIVCYALYTLSPQTVEKFGSSRLSFTIPFVIFGLFRYLDLVYRHNKGGRPEMILLTDKPLILDLLLYGLSVILILFVW